MGSARVVGRDSELSRLDRACEASRRGQGVAICLTGPAGIGKTALLRAAQRQARRLDLVTVSTWCWAEGAPPLWPWLDLLAQLGTRGEGTPQMDKHVADGHRRPGPGAGRRDDR